MPVTVIDTNFTTITATQSDEFFIIEEGVQGTATGTDHGVDFTGFSVNALRLGGTLTVEDGDGVSTDAVSAFADVRVKSTGGVETTGGVGVRLQGQYSRFVNRGEVHSEETTSLYLQGNFSQATNKGLLKSTGGLASGALITGDFVSFSNTGDVKGEEAGVQVSAGAAVGIVNDGLIKGLGSLSKGLFTLGTSSVLVENSGTIKGETGIFATGLRIRVMNDGLIKGTGGTAFFATSTPAEIVNSGTFDGDVQLGSADDTFIVEKGGEVLGDLLGGDGADFFDLHKADDVAYGEAGDDEIHGGKGTDEIYGGDDDDTLYGDKGADLVEGEAGEDTIWGGKGDDELLGGDDNDNIYAQEGDDVLRGGADDDGLYGGEGDDKLYGGDGVDKLHGEEGDDKLWGDDGDDFFIWYPWYDGDDIVKDFVQGEDKITLYFTSTTTEIDDFFANDITSSGGDAIVDLTGALGGNAIITVKGMAGALLETDFIIGS